MSIKLNAQSGGSVALDAPTQTTSSADNVYKLPVADGTAGQVLMTDGSGNLSWVTPGITMADEWRVSANISSASGAATVSSNWERNDNASFGGIGSAMTESSGIFTFPQTGIYLIIASAAFYGANNAYSGIGIRGTTDNSNYHNLSVAYTPQNSSSTLNSNVNTQGIFDCTNVSTHKILMRYLIDGSTTIVGSTDTHLTGFTFIRLGDT